MSLLDFTQVKDKYESTFVSGEKNVIQILFNKPVDSVKIYARVDDALSWDLLKAFISPAQNFMYAFNFSAGSTIKVETSSEVAKAACVVYSSGDSGNISGFSDIEVSVENGTGTPSASGTVEEGKLKLVFSNIKGEKGTSEYVAKVEPTPSSSQGLDAQISSTDITTTSTSKPNDGDFILYGVKKYVIIGSQPLRDGVSMYFLKMVSDGSESPIVQSIKETLNTLSESADLSEAIVAQVAKTTSEVTALALQVDEKAKVLEASANKAIEDANKAIVDVEQIDAEIVEHFLMVTDRNGDKHKIDLYDALQKITYEIVNTDVEGYMRVAGISDPSLSYRQFPRSEFGKSVFSIFYPCLVGNNFTGRVGEILHILDKLNYERDIEGNARKIDGSEGEVLITNIKSYWAIHGSYKIDGVEYDIFLESLNPFTFHGIEAIEVKPFGWSPDYCVSHKDADNVTRMHSVYNPAWAGSYSAPIGIVGRYNYSTDESGNIVEQYDADGLINGNANGNHTTDIALYTGEQYAMNINTDKTKTYPYMNHTARGAELLWANMVAETGTFDAHKEVLMGSGYCCNYSASAASYWEAAYTGARNGIRYVAADGTTKYTTFGYLTALQKQVFGLNINCMAQMINQYRSPWKCLERHRVIAYAIDNKIAELTWFTFEGNKYKWRSVPGIAGPDGGEMTCVLWKIMSANLASGTIDPTDGVTSVAGNRIEYLVSTALYHGMVTDVSPSWWTSGLILSQYGDGTYKAYMQRDQRKLIISENATKNEDESFNFETRYKQVGDVYDKAEGYRKNYCNDAFMLPDTNANLKGAALHTYVGAYNWFTGTVPAVGKKASRGFRRGYLAGSSTLSPLTLFGYGAPSGASSACAFGICCEIEISGS